MDDNRLRGFSPPPWAALGRRDPNHQQAPWRDSENVEDRRQMTWGDYLSAKANQVGHTFAAVPDAISALGARPASDELMQRYMEEISQSLPQDETPRLGPYERPMVYAEMADGGPVERDPPERSLVDRAWDARPWKDYATNPPSMLPQLGTALGLLHPRLGGAVRDMGMARELARQGSTPAVMQGMPPGMHARAPEAGHLSRPPAPMGMRQGTANSNKPMSRVEQFEAHLASLERAGVPYEQFPTWQAFFRGLDGKADGGAVDQPKQPSFSEPLSGFIDRTVGGLKDYGRTAMTEAGWAPWAKGAGEVAMSVATSPFESVSSASKLAAAPVDWATGREVSASPWDVLGALPIAALGGARAAGHISRNRDALRRQDALDSLTGARRERGDLSGTDLRIKQLIDEMASRRNMD